MIPIGREWLGAFVIVTGLVRGVTEAVEVLAERREVVLMVKIAGSFAVLLLVYGAEGQEAQKPATSAPAAIQDWKGTLVDANCSGGSNASGAKSEGTTVDTGRPKKGHKKEPQAQSCPVGSSTTAFALKTEGGQVMKFDGVGNARAAEELKTKPAWTKNVSAGKPIRAKVSGILNGETITVTSIG